MEALNFEATPLGDKNLTLAQRIEYGVKHLNLTSVQAAQLVAIMDGKPFEDYRSK